MKFVQHYGRLAQGLLAVAFLGTLAGCGGAQDTRWSRYQLSGTVTYGGEPVAQGDISFTPDGDQGNDGPGSFCLIQNGQFVTPPNKGVTGGAYVLTINGYKPSATPGDEEPLFESHVERLTLPKEAHTVKIDIPVKK